jgi:hypothetical protein
MKFKLLVVLLFAFLGAFAQPSQYTPMTAQGYQMKRVKVDSTLHLPSFCGVPTLRGSAAIDGAIAIDTCANVLYKWTNAGGWSAITGGGGSTDTTSLSNRIDARVKYTDTAAMLANYLTGIDTISLNNRINGKVDSVKRVGDSVKFYKNGVGYFAFLDSVGGSTIDTTSLSNRINNKIDSLKRITDSVFAYRNGNQIFQYKDSVGTNPPPNGYYGAFQDNTTQTAASINTAYPVKFNTTDLTNGVTISNNTKIKIANAGIYNIQFSLQLEKTGGSGNMIVDIWLRKNGVNIDGTTGKVVLTGSVNASPIVAAWNYLISVSSGDSIQLMWSTNNTNVEIVAAGPTTPYPSIPSSILTVTQQSGIMAGTGINPLDTANMLLPYLRKADTTVFQRKQLAAYSFTANATNAAANGSATAFKDTSGTYTGTITWSGTAPSGTTNHSFRIVQVGRMVTVTIFLVYATNGAAVGQVILELPSGAPAVAEPPGLTGASQNMYPVLVWFSASNNSILSNAARGFLRNNTANTANEIIVQSSSSAPNSAHITLTYYTN